MLILVMLIIACGELLTVIGEVEFSLVGFLLCLTAAGLSGCRWTLVQLKIQSMDPPLKNAVSTMRLLAPSMFWSLLLLSALIEQPWQLYNNSSSTVSDEVVRLVYLGIGGAVLAICMILCEFHLIMHASAIILLMGGMMKEIITILVGVRFFGDQLNRINVIGLIIVLTGVALYKVHYHLEKQEEEKQEDDYTDQQHGLLLNGHDHAKENDDDGYNGNTATRKKKQRYPSPSRRHVQENGVELRHFLNVPNGDHNSNNG